MLDEEPFLKEDEVETWAEMIKDEIKKYHNNKQPLPGNFETINLIRQHAETGLIDSKKVHDYAFLNFREEFESMGYWYAGPVSVVPPAHPEGEFHIEQDIRYTKQNFIN